MNEYLAAIQGANQWHWGNGPYQYFFYIGILLVLLFEKRKTFRIVFCFFPLVYLLLIYNPLYEKAMQFIFGGGYYYQYFSRMFSFIPLMYGIACGVMQGIIKTRGWYKFVCVTGVLVVVIFSGNNFYHEDWMKPALNPEKVPADSFQVIESLGKSERKICVAFPSPLNVYARQIDAEIITPYGRYMNELGEMLDQQRPDVDELMIEAGKQAVDYIVIKKSEETRSAFSEKGYLPWDETDLYIIYAVNRVPRTLRSYNEKNQIIYERYIDEEGNAIQKNDGYSAIAFEYDSWGYDYKETFLDDEGNCVQRKGGYVSILTEYNPLSRLLESISYLDKDGQAVLMGGCYKTKYKYNNSKKIREESYYDSLGNLMNREDGYYAYKRFEYNKRNQVVEEKYFDISGKPTVSSFGYASCKYEYDDDGRLSATRYYDANEEMVKNAYGYAGILRTYGENANTICDTYLNENNEPFMLNDSHASTLWEEDTNGNVLFEKYYDTEGNMICRNAGYAEVRRKYDGERLVEESYWDEKGKETCNYEGYHRVEIAYDGFGNVIEKRTFDEEGNLI